MTHRDEIAKKYGITAAHDPEELEYAVKWELDNAIGYQPINHNRKPASARTMRLVRQLNNEGY